MRRSLIPFLSLALVPTTAIAQQNAAPPASPTLPSLTLNGPSGLTLTDGQDKKAIAINPKSGQLRVDGPMDLRNVIYGYPNDNVWNLTSELYYAGQGDTHQHVAGYFQTVRGAKSGGDHPPQLWSGVFEYRDRTGQPSSRTGVGLTLELDYVANGADDYSQQIGRAVVPIVLEKDDPNGAPVEVTSAITTNIVGGAKNGWFKSIFNLATPFTQAAFDTRRATQFDGANAIWLKRDQTVAFDTAGPNGAANAKLWSDGQVLYSSAPLQTDGGVRVAGPLVYSTRRVVSGTSDTARSSDVVIAWHSSASGAKTQMIPACSKQELGHTLYIKDEAGTSVTDAITVVPSSGTIEGGNSLALATRRGSLRLTCDGSGNWMSL